MSIFRQAAEEAERRRAAASEPAPTPTAIGSGTARLHEREATVEVAGTTVPIEEPETIKTDEDGTWITGEKLYGRPRGRDALEARQIVQTSAMQAIANGITDQLVGGELTFESDDGDLGSAEAEVQALLREVLTGPHLGGHDLDDLITASVEDMLGPGNAYWQLHPPADGAGVDLPVVSLSTLDALTVRHNVNRHGYPLDPPYWQASGAFTSDGIGTLGAIDPVPLQDEDVAVMHYPRGNRSYKFYPTSPSLQVKRWLEVLANSTTHHNRFYADNEIPPGVLQIIGAGDNSVGKVKDEIQAASGDPRDFPVIGGEGGAQWLDLGGTAVNLNIIEEQKWFFQLCLASLGLGKQELGFIEDVNRSNGEVESSRIFKRVMGPFGKQFENAFLHIARQFDVYNALDAPFTIHLRFTDPREEQARQERLRQQYQSGLRTYNDFQEAVGNDPSEIDTTVEIVDGVTIDYGDKPRPVVESLMIARRMEAMSDVDEEGAEEAAEQMAAAFDDPAEGDDEE